MRNRYHIAGNFRGVKFSRNDDYKVFADLIFEDRPTGHTLTIVTTPPAGSDTRYVPPPLEKSDRV